MSSLRRNALPLASAVVLGAALAPAGCATARTTELEPRYVAVHDAFAALGMAEVGPLHRGSLAEGREARFDVGLPAGCVTIGAFGGAGVRDLDVELLDADGKSVAHDAAGDPSAFAHACRETGGRATVVVRMKRGAGDFLAASWTGGTDKTGGAPAPSAGLAAGTCESPIPLAAGSIADNTRRGEAENAGTCGTSDAKELVYLLEVPRRQRVILELEPNAFDSVLYLRKDDCTSKEAEVACNDDAATTASKRSGGTHGSRLDEILDPGRYWVFVDGYNNEAGAFRMNAEISDVPTLAEACTKAPRLVQRTSGTLTGAFNHAGGTCDRGRGPDAVYRLDLPQKARTRLVLHTDEFSPVLHLRRSCLDEQSEVGCTDAGIKSEEAAFVSVLDRGSYSVFADSGDKSAHGRYTLEAELAPEAGTGARGDACGDAILLGTDDPAVDGDTFTARDDFAGSCAAPGAPDVVYRFEVLRRSRVTAKLLAEEGDHALVLMRACTDRASEVSCGGVVDEIVSPGSYWLVVDGTTKGPFGRFTLQLRAKDVAAQETACRGAPAMTLGQTVTGTTAGAPDHFAESCAGREDAQASGDKVYRLTLAARTHVLLTLSTPNHDGVLAIRRACTDPPKAKSLAVNEVGCNNDSPDKTHSKLDRTLDAGTYYVVVDGHQGKNEGSFTLEAKAVK